MGFEAHEISSYDHPVLGFGITVKKAAAQLRKLADEIEKPQDPGNFNGEYICLQQATTAYEVNREDYAMTTITLKFATRKGPRPYMPSEQGEPAQ